MDGRMESELLDIFFILVSNERSHENRKYHTIITKCPLVYTAAFQVRF